MPVSTSENIITQLEPTHGNIDIGTKNTHTQNA